jgi:hypothetical protein
VVPVTSVLKVGVLDEIAIGHLHFYVRTKWAPRVLRPG